MFKKITDKKELNALIVAWHSRRAQTNFFLKEEEYLPVAKQFQVMRFDRGCYLILEKDTHFMFYFFLENHAHPVELPMLHKPVVLEQVCLERKGQEPKASVWETLGFAPYLMRKRLMMPMQTGISASSVPQFATLAQADEILQLMQESFEPYTSALPTKQELIASIQNKEVLTAMEDEKMLGFLRFGAQKKVSVLWQIVVKEEERDRGVGRMLTKQWIWQVKDTALRCELWVREDNPSAQRMYEMLGFLPDGRIAPVMIKNHI